jgi:membrane protease YdiL (CAAX protease family)
MVIYERDNEFLNFLTPALVSVGGSILLVVFQVLVAIPLVGLLINLPEFADPLYTPVWDLIILFLSQVLGTIIIIALIIPWLKIKHVEKYSLRGKTFVDTILLICLIWALIFVISTLMVILIEFFNLEEPRSGLSELLIPEEIMSPLTVIFLLTPIVIGAPLFEELLYRRILIPLLEERGMSPLGAVLASSLFFTLLHAPTDIISGNYTGTVVHLTAVLVLAFGLGFSYIKTRNILYPMIIHGGINAISTIATVVQYDSELLMRYMEFVLIVVLVGFVYAIVIGWKKRSNLHDIIRKPEINITRSFLGYLVISLGLLTFQTVSHILSLEFSLLIVCPLLLIVLGGIISNTEYLPEEKLTENQEDRNSRFKQQKNQLEEEGAEPSLSTL